MTGTGRISAGRTLLMVAFTIPFLYPLYFLVTVAFRTQRSYVQDPLGLPNDLTLNHLTETWTNANLGQATINSLIVVSLTTIITITVCSLAGFWFARRTSRWPNIVLAGIVGAWVIPYVIYLIPLYTILANAGLVNNLYTLALFYAATNIPFGLFLITQYMRIGVPDEVREAARVDGASTWSEFARVVLPLTRPALATVAALTFIGTWGDLLTAVVMLQDQAKWTLPVASAALVQAQDSHIQAQAAAALVAMVPILIVFLFSQRSLIRGITAGVGK